VGLDHFVIPLCLTTVISGMEELDFIKKERPIGEDPDLLILVQSGEVKPISFPNYGDRRTPGYVTIVNSIENQRIGGRRLGRNTEWMESIPTYHFNSRLSPTVALTWVSSSALSSEMTLTE